MLGLRTVYGCNGLSVILLLALGGFFAPSRAFGTEVSGPIATNTTWASSGSPYVFTGDVTVQSGAVLTVDAGVEVQLKDFDLLVGASSSSAGRLLADGATFCDSGTVHLRYGTGQSVQNCDIIDGTRFNLWSSASGTFANNDILYVGSYYAPLVVNSGWTVSGGTVSLTATYGTDLEAIACGAGAALSSIGITGSGTRAVFGVKILGNTTISGCTISGFRYPYYYTAGNMSLSGNVIDGNERLAIAIGGDYTSSGFFHAEWGLPIEVGGSYFSVCGATLRIDPGVEVRLNGKEFSVGFNSGITGKLVANGVTFLGGGLGGGRVSLLYGSGQSVQNTDFGNGASLYLSNGASGTIAGNDFVTSGTALEVRGPWTVSGGTISITTSSFSPRKAAAYCSSGAPRLQDMTITGSGPGAAFGVEATCDAVIDGCTISGFDYPYFICGGDPTISGNAISENDTQMVATGGNLCATGSFRSDWGMPIRVLSPGLTVICGASLTLDEGVEILLNGRALSVSAGTILATGAGFIGPGVFRLQGSSGQSVQNCDFTNDIRVFLDDAASGTFVDNDITYSGSEDAVVVGGTWAISGGTVSLTAPSGSVNGIAFSGDALTLADVVISGSGPGAACGVKALGNASISGCTISGFDYPYYLCNGDQTLSANTIAGNDSLIVATGGDYLLSGGFHSEWGLPVKFLASGVTVKNGATLTVDPGVEVRMNGWDLLVGPSSDSPGTLSAHGATFRGPGLLTLEYASGQSVEDCDFVGGSRINLLSSASGTFAGNSFTYSGTGVPLSGNGAWTITGGTIVASAPAAVSWSYGQLTLVGVTLRNADVGLLLTMIAEGAAHYCNFIDTPLYGVRNQSVFQADARWCYWDDPSGPSGAGPGAGVPVSETVLFEPWMEEPATGPPPFSIATAMFDTDAYQNGADTASLVVHTRNNWGTATGLSLHSSVISNLGDRFDLSPDGFSLPVGEEHVSEFFWAVPDSGYPWDFDLRLTLVEGGDTVLAYDAPSAFTGMLLTQSERAEALAALHDSECLPPDDTCALQAGDALPYAGPLSSVTGYVDDMCAAGNALRAGHYMRGGIDFLGAVIPAVDATLDAIEVLAEVPASTLPDAVDSATSCGFHLTLGSLPGDERGAGPRLVDTLLAEVAEGFAEIGREYSNEIFVVGNASLRVGVDDRWTSPDSLGISKAIVFGAAEGALQWAHVGRGPVPFGAAGENPHSAIRARIRGAGSDTVDVGLLHRTAEDSVLQLQYPPVELQLGVVAWMDLADTAQVFPLQVDFDGDGIADTTYFPSGGVETGASDGPVTAANVLRLLANRPNPFNAATEIRYVLPATTDVRLAIYGVSGRLVKVLVDARVAAGEHRAVWDGRTPSGEDPASGVYFAKLETGGKVLTQKIILVR